MCRVTDILMEQRKYKIHLEKISSIGKGSLSSRNHASSEQRDHLRQI
jgi:hypothetical protein